MVFQYFIVSLFLEWECPFNVQFLISPLLPNIVANMISYSFLLQTNFKKTSEATKHSSSSENEQEDMYRVSYKSRKEVCSPN